MGEPRSVLIVGQQPDVHIDAVRDAVCKMGAQVVCFDRGVQDFLTISPGADARSSILATPRGAISLGAIHAVWWRVKPSTPVEFGSGIGDVSDAFRWREWKAALSSLSVVTPKALWVNPHPANFEAARKPQQLMLAQELGFRIPETVITNSADQALKLFERHARVIYKTLSSFLIPPDEMIYTNEISREELRCSQDQLALAPGMFQEYVPKAYEMRVTVVGTRCFPIRIDSQNASETKIDWRRSQLREMYRVCSLSKPTERRIGEFMSRSGIRFGAIDFVVTPSGEEVFLECNPGGQWLWLEHRTGSAITTALADMLVNG